ncbi:MAG: histidine kinase [Bacteroidales bacterium]|nr:histidine kinase [Bacteroidales bacterium]
MRKTYTIALFLVIPLTGILISLMYLISEGFEDTTPAIMSILHGILMTAGLWIGCMGIVSLLWKKYPWEHHPLKHLVFEVTAIIAYTLLFSGTVYYIELKLGFPHNQEINIFLDATVTILITLFITSVHEAVFFYQQWKQNFSKSVKLEKDNIEAKYEALKSQINPHFLFNSLNSLISLVDNNDRATDYIQNLSDFLRYVLKRNERQLVLLREELQILYKYLKIMQIRYENNLVVHVNISESYYHFCIPPLTLQVLVENCIKHNVISTENPLSIRIFSENESVTIENNLQPKFDTYSTGQGLKNLTERYRFFVSREIVIKKSNHTFAVTVPLILADL